MHVYQDHRQRFFQNPFQPITLLFVVFHNLGETWPVCSPYQDGALNANIVTLSQGQGHWQHFLQNPLRPITLLPVIRL